MDAQPLPEQPSSPPSPLQSVSPTAPWLKRWSWSSSPAAEAAAAAGHHQLQQQDISINSLRFHHNRRHHRSQLTAGDTRLCAAVGCALLLCWLSLAPNGGAQHASRATSAVLSSPHSSSPDVVAVHSRLVGVDLSAEQLVLEVVVTHSGQLAHCATAAGALLHLAVGTGTPTSAAPAALLPLCQALAGVSAEAASLGSERAAYRVRLPLRAAPGSRPHPFEALAADVRLSLLPCGRPAQHTRVRGAQAGQPQLAGSCSRQALAHISASVPSVHWTASWAAPGVALSVVRQHGSSSSGGAAARLVAAALAAGHSSEDAMALQHGLAHAAPAPQAVLRLHVRQRQWLRVMHLACGLLHGLALLWGASVVLGHAADAFVLHRFLCSARAHGTRVTWQQ